MNAASLNVAELYVAAFQQLAKTNNTLILPASANDVTSMVGTAMSMYQTLAKKNETNASSPGNTKETTGDDGMAEYYSDEDEKPKH
jgi:hypothetical protein